MSRPTLSPSSDQDAISEFKSTNKHVGPEFGRIAGGVINLTSKSGTNQFHGSGYEFFGTKLLNANNFSITVAARHGQPSRRISMARISADRSRGTRRFFFFSWEGFRLRQGQPLSAKRSDRPTARRRLLDTRTATGALTTIFDPATTTCASAATCGTSGAVRSAFPNNIIPSNRLDPAAKILSTYWASRIRRVAAHESQELQQQRERRRWQR